MFTQFKKNVQESLTRTISNISKSQDIDTLKRNVLNVQELCAKWQADINEFKTFLELSKKYTVPDSKKRNESFEYLELKKEAHYIMSIDTLPSGNKYATFFEEGSCDSCENYTTVKIDHFSENYPFSSMFIKDKVYIFEMAHNATGTVQYYKFINSVCIEEAEE